MKIDLYRQNRDYNIKYLIKFCIHKVSLSLILSGAFCQMCVNSGVSDE